MTPARGMLALAQPKSQGWLAHSPAAQHLVVGGCQMQLGRPDELLALAERLRNHFGACLEVARNAHHAEPAEHMQS